MSSKVNKFNDKSAPELRLLLREAQQELRNLRRRVAQQDLKNVRAIRAARTTIARLQTRLQTKKAE